MAALTPGRAFRFKLQMEGETLVPMQGERALKTKQDRVSFLDSEGWSVPDARASGWEHHRIAYYDKEIDDVGEGEIGEIESHFSGYIDELADTISQKLTHENWDRIHVVTDHGFVLLPEDTAMESVSVNYLNSEVKYRRVAGDEVEHAGTGVHLDANTPGLDYLDTNLQLLVDPRQHYSKQGYSNSRYYHGGLLPQECMLSFLRVEQ